MQRYKLFPTPPNYNQNYFTNISSGHIRVRILCDNSSEQGGSGSSSSTGSETETVEAPVISGETPFDESTQVSISGPDGAEIRYTTDGTAPNAQSNLYSEAITLTDTATVKAIAIKNGVSSEAATKVFTKNGSNVGSGGFETGN